MRQITHPLANAVHRVLPITGIHPETVLAHLTTRAAQKMVPTAANHQILTQELSDYSDRLIMGARSGTEQFHIVVAECHSYKAVNTELSDDAVADDMFSRKSSNYGGCEQDTWNFDQMLQLLVFVVMGRPKSREWTTWHGQKSRGGQRGSERSRA